MTTYPLTENASFYMEQPLYEELFETEVEHYDSDDIENDKLRPSHLQFIQGMLNREKQDETQVFLTMTNDGIEYLLHTALPTHMEMWSGWGSARTYTLTNAARHLFESFGLYCPY